MSDNLHKRLSAGPPDDDGDDFFDRFEIAIDPDADQVDVADALARFALAVVQGRSPEDHRTEEA